MRRKPAAAFERTHFFVTFLLRNKKVKKKFYYAFTKAYQMNNKFFIKNFLILVTRSFSEGSN